MKIAGAQIDLAWENRPLNFDKARQMAAKAKNAGADLLILPEMFATAFSLDLTVTAESPAGPTATFLRSVAKEFGLAVVGGFVMDRGDGGARNVALALDSQGNDLALYAKNHLISLLGEDAVHVPGEGPVPFDVGEVTTACFICYDLRFPELFRAVADECALMLVIASWPAVRQSHWDLLLRARAVENQCFVVGVNRVGEGGGLAFSGGSAIIDPWGELLAHGGDEEALVMAIMDPEKTREIRNCFPFLKDRKT